MSAELAGRLGLQFVRDRASVGELDARHAIQQVETVDQLVQRLHVADDQLGAALVEFLGRPLMLAGIPVRDGGGVQRVGVGHLGGEADGQAPPRHRRGDMIYKGLHVGSRALVA